MSTRRTYKEASDRFVGVTLGAFEVLIGGFLAGISVVCVSDGSLVGVVFGVCSGVAALGAWVLAGVIFRDVLRGWWESSW